MIVLIFVVVVVILSTHMPTEDLASNINDHFPQMDIVLSTIPMIYVLFHTYTTDTMYSEK